MATRREYLDRFKQIRHKRVMKKAGKALLVDEDTMLGLIAERKVPTMVQHCVLKVKKKMDLKHANEKDAYLSAFNICIWVFREYGYMRRNGFTMTGKGVKRNRLHQREKEAAQKRSKYDRLTNRLWRAAIADYNEEKRNRRRR